MKLGSRTMGARLVKEGDGRLFLDEIDLWTQGKFVTNNIVTRTDYIQINPSPQKIARCKCK